ncbi:hypothetical protein ISR94_00475 [Candidatus Microgenomates bacterium]|nr:hypothetical protein [Candidatus Microgenomates bacterium]
MSHDTLKEWNRQLQLNIIDHHLSGNRPTQDQRLERIQLSLHLRPLATDAQFQGNPKEAALLREVANNLIASAG